jgi:bifunctional non-homologous end joining protein LigD
MTRRPSDSLPDFIEPELATLVERAPEGDGWVHEIKIDGYRTAARIDRGKVQMLTHHANGWMPRFRSNRRALLQPQGPLGIPRRKSPC